MMRRQFLLPWLSTRIRERDRKVTEKLFFWDHMVTGTGLKLEWPMKCKSNRSYPFISTHKLASCWYNPLIRTFEHLFNGVWGDNKANQVVRMDGRDNLGQQSNCKCHSFMIRQFLSPTKHKRRHRADDNCCGWSSTCYPGYRLNHLIRLQARWCTNNPIFF